MDDDDLRRGRPTCHKVYGEALAVLVGDALLTLAFEMVAELPASDAVRALATGCGESRVWSEDRSPTSNRRAPMEIGSSHRVQWIHDHKTAALIRASLLVGAHAGGGELDGFAMPWLAMAMSIGRAFQIADDCLDLTGSEKNLGKRPGQDRGREQADVSRCHGAFCESGKRPHGSWKRRNNSLWQYAPRASEGLESARRLLLRCSAIHQCLEAPKA